MNTELGTLIYEGQKQQVIWQGYELADNKAFNNFLQNEVHARLNDDEGSEEFKSHLRSLSLTDFGSKALESVLKADITEERDWAIGEAVAEVWLAREHMVIWPWNMTRDKRHANASLPGADLIGFIQQGEEIRLVLGEVKSSTEQKFPPQVMSGRKNGIGHQIDSLANDLSKIHILLKWLLPRCKNTEFKDFYNAAVKLYLNSENRAVSLFGVLIRDTKPNELDLKSRGHFLGDKLTSPTSCALLALHLPCKISQLLQYLRRGGAS